jgi:monoamine oxidase
MIPTHQFVKRYKNFEIFLRRPGFESIPIAFGKVASFITRSQDGPTAVFAFAYSGLKALQNTSINEVELLKKAVVEIERFIGDKKIENNHEYTFEYQGDSFREVPNAAWWVKTT